MSQYSIIIIIKMKKKLMLISKERHQVMINKKTNTFDLEKIT